MQILTNSGIWRQVGQAGEAHGQGGWEGVMGRSCMRYSMVAMAPQPNVTAGQQLGWSHWLGRPQCRGVQVDVVEGQFTI